MVNREQTKQNTVLVRTLIMAGAGHCMPFTPTLSPYTKQFHCPRQPQGLTLISLEPDTSSSPKPSVRPCGSLFSTGLGELHLARLFPCADASQTPLRCGIVRMVRNCWYAVTHKPLCRPIELTHLNASGSLGAASMGRTRTRAPRWTCRTPSLMSNIEFAAPALLSANVYDRKSSYILFLAWRGLQVNLERG